MPRPVAFNAETPRDIIRTVERMKVTPYARLERRQSKEKEQPWILVVTPPSGGIATGTSDTCTVQLVDESTGAISDDSNYTSALTVVNPYPNTIGNNVDFIVVGRIHTGVWIPIAEACT